LTRVGNNYGLGSTRKDELTKACEVIGAKECHVLDRKDIQDNPKEWWDENTILPVIEKWVSKLKADAVCLKRKRSNQLRKTLTQFGDHHL
jgi:N-acetylglucosaminylphosphatidylinositol deacetylase